MTTGICLAQLGTPDEPTAPALRRYLAAFLSDRRVVDLSPWIWKPILHGIILRTRPARSAAKYQRIWTEAGSPLLVATVSLADKLGAHLGAAFVVRPGMRIGRPPLAERLDDLVAAGCERVFVLPCFPQWSTTTSLSVQDAVEAWQAARPGAPPAEILGSFPADPLYIEALAASVRAAGFQPSVETPLVISFHGIPEKVAQRGDPYPRECEATAAALVAALGLPDEAWRMTYQSRFGPAAWLQPYTDETLRALARQGAREVGIIAPSFLADCLETIDEIGRELREVFEEAGGTSLVRVPCLNDDDALVRALAARIHAKMPASP